MRNIFFHKLNTTNMILKLQVWRNKCL